MTRAAIVILLTVAVVAAPRQSGSAEKQLEAAIHQEVVLGDLKAAIEQYKKVAQSGNRAAAAKALVRMGECYEKLGDAEARKAYERVVREFGDQREAAETARARLAADRESRPAGGIVARQVWTNSATDWNAVLSPDGRYLSFIDGDGGLSIRDLATGENRRLAIKGSWNDSWDQAYPSAFSPDGKQVAYGWRDAKARSTELHVIDFAGSSPRVIYRGSDSELVVAYGWSRDGREILAGHLKTDEPSEKQARLVWVSLADGSMRVIKTAARTSRTPKISLSPDKRYIVFEYDEKGGRSQVFLMTADGKNQVPLAPEQADNNSPVWTPDGKSIFFLSNRSGSPGLWRIAVADGKPAGSPELLRQNMGRSVLIGFSPKGSLYCTFINDLVDVYVATVDLDSGKVLEPPRRVLEQFVGQNSWGRWSPDGRYLAYVRPGGSRPFFTSPAIHILSLQSGEEREVPIKINGFHGSFYCWSPDGRSFLVGGSGADNGSSGFYRVDAQSGQVKPVAMLDPGEDLMQPAFSPDGRTLFYRAGESIVAREIATGRKKELIRSNVGEWIGGLVVSPDGRNMALVGNRLDQGMALKIVPADGGEVRELFKAPKGSAINMLSVAWSPDGRRVVFASAGGLWTVPAEGGPARRTELGPVQQYLTGVRVHPDGRRLVFHDGKPSVELWAIDNLLSARQP